MSIPWPVAIGVFAAMFLLAGALGACAALRELRRHAQDGDRDE